MYIDSRGKEYIVAEMPLIMVFNTVIKYGKKDLEEKGYTELIARFESAFDKLELRKLINEFKEEN
jgi:hypothetical protein